jgi:hypothetical protein
MSPWDPACSIYIIWQRAGCNRLENSSFLVEILSRCRQIRWGTWRGHGGTWRGYGRDKSGTWWNIEGHGGSMKGTATEFEGT